MVNLCIVLLCIKEFVRCILYCTCKCIDNVTMMYYIIYTDYISCGGYKILQELIFVTLTDHYQIAKHKLKMNKSIV